MFHCFAHCLLPGRAFASLYALLFLEKEAEIGGLEVAISKNVFLSLKIDFVLANGVDPIEMPHNVAFHLRPHNLPKYPFSGSQSSYG